MNKLYFILVFTVFVFMISATSAAEQPLARIAICDVNGDCQVADSGEYIEIQACNNIILKDDSRDPLDLPLTGVKWIIKEEGKENAEIIRGSKLNFTWPESGYVHVALNVSNGVFSHETYIIMAVRENKVPKIEKIIAIVGTDENETTFEPNMHQDIQTAAGVPITIKRIYEERKDSDVLKPDVKGDSSILISDSECDGYECDTTLNFTKEGTFMVSFSDHTLCGVSELATVEVRVFQNRPPNKVEISGEFAGESSVSVSGKNSEDNDPWDEITTYNWTVSDKNGMIVSNDISESPEFYFSDEPGNYNVTLCVTDRYKGIACSEPESILIFGLETLKADPSETLRDAVVGQNITLNATRSTPKRIIDYYEWRMCYSDDKRCVDERRIRTSSPATNVTVNRSGMYNVELRIYVGNKTDDSSEFSINVKSAPKKSIFEEMPASTANVTTSTAMTTATRTKSSETEMKPETPAPGILPALVILCLVWSIKRR